MPQITDQDKDRRFWTEMRGFFRPEGASPPVVNFTPEGVQLVNGGAGIYTIILPASYTAASIVGYALFSNTHKAAQISTPIYNLVIFGAGAPAFPQIPCCLMNQNGGGVGNVTMTGDAGIVWNLYLKFNTVVA